MQEGIPITEHSMWAYLLLFGQGIKLMVPVLTVVVRAYAVRKYTSTHNDMYGQRKQCKSSTNVVNWARLFVKISNINI